MKEIRNIKESDDEYDFENQYESAPPEIKQLIDDAGMEIEDGGNSYKLLKQLNSDLNELGWEIEFGLDGGITALTRK